ncbi:MAG: OmpH family outer membrane protein [Verrucomicrobia bacterium]|nr:OmpH family outer membrane protein [Verrucomicrobiota bacterium]
MKFLPISLRCTTLCFCLGLLVGNPGALAQDLSKVAVMDYNAVMKDYHKAKESKDKIEKMATDYRKEGDGRNASVKAIRETAEALQKDLSDPAISDKLKKEKEAQLKSKVEEFQIKQQEFLAWNNTVSKIMQDQTQRETTALLAEVEKAVQQVCKNKYSMVFSKNQSGGGPVVPGLMTFSDGIDDITPQVLAILNKDAAAAPAAKKEEKK